MRIIVGQKISYDYDQGPETNGRRKNKLQQVMRVTHVADYGITGFILNGFRAERQDRDINLISNIKIIEDVEQ